MPTDIIQWFPGHMAKTRRLMKECLPDVDIVIELLDARIPYSSANPEIKSIIGSKPSVTLLNKSGLADPNAGKLWIRALSEEGRAPVLCDCIDKTGLGDLKNAINVRLADKLESYRKKGMQGRHIRAMVVGIPNVGKSSLINTLAGTKSAAVENRPGVTLRKQWITTKIGIDLLDMPGVLWPKFEQRRVGENLCITGAVKDEIVEIHSIASALCMRLKSYYPEELKARYKLTDEMLEGDGYFIMENVCKKRGFLLRGGEFDYERCANVLLDEFRAGKIGRITLERP